jgi:hypothetical protein
MGSEDLTYMECNFITESAIKNIETNNNELIAINTYSDNPKLEKRLNKTTFSPKFQRKKSKNPIHSVFE